jgi:haloacetate dehalogenase
MPDCGMFDGFTSEVRTINGVRIHFVLSGAGPPVLLVHGYPQSHVMWHRIAPSLAARFTVVCPDVRGYGDSDKPPSGPSHSAYSKRELARDQLQLMRQLGFNRFAVVGHDRGARVARRLALDHPDAVAKLALLDIVPTQHIYEDLDQAHATTVWRYFFLVQPFDLPERLIASDPSYYLRWTWDEWAEDPNALDPEARSEYERCFDAATIHATCEDYRAGATIDLVHDREDADRLISCPLLLLWSASGIGSSYDVMGCWAGAAADVHGHAVECGHFLAEEQPERIVSELLAFL